ncbi:alpha/beta hydrolase [Luteimonas chenhongjianii]|uniref:Alpha/beta hydrolase n=1 Tax=Luteimonas chenhongjianii TaxID=2006110 RepID=A0A290XAZ4_9GAMM|nr:alpha/beta hydrolase [Luteimonas chenhongjianii]ATD66334.1 alpha/beta hydrolase [Luteimonas chenhongjianii]
MTAAGPGQPFEVEIGIGTVRGLRFGRAGGRRVLALHGWLDNAASFVPLAAHLDGLDLVAPDLPGHGRSAHMPVGTDYTFVGAVHQVLDIADALGWERFALLGHSMGAGIASLVAAAIPERIERLVAIEALGALPEPESGTVPRLREAVAASRGQGTRALRVFPDVEAPVRARMRVNGLSEPVARLLVERGVRAVDGGLVWCSDPRLTIPTAVRMTPGQVDALIAGIECPARVIYADPPQPYLPEPDRTRRAGLLPDGELTVISGGHHLHMEQPAEVASVIGDFLLR